MTENKAINDIKINTESRTDSKLISIIYYLTLVSESEQF
jgi:hypothetical protein